MVLEKTLESPLDCKEIQQVHPKENQSWIFIRRTDAEAETPILQLPDAKNWLIGKDPDAGINWRWEEKGMTESEMVGGITDTTEMSLGKLWDLVMDREAWHATAHGVAKSWIWLRDWTELKMNMLYTSAVQHCTYSQQYCIIHLKIWVDTMLCALMTINFLIKFKKENPQTLMPDYLRYEERREETILVCWIDRGLVLL